MQMMQPSDGQKRQNFLIGGHGEERREKKEEKKEGHHGWLIGQKKAEPILRGRNTAVAVTKTRIETVYGMVWLPEVNRNVDLQKMEPMVWSSNEQSA